VASCFGILDVFPPPGIFDSETHLEIHRLVVQILGDALDFGWRT
jgi:hypothetical protein